MRSLFLKLFLWYWLTALLVAVALVLAWSLQPDQVVSRWRSVAGDALAMYSATAAEVADTRGAAAVNDFLAQMQHSSGISAVLVGADLQPISGSLRGDEGELAARALRSNGPELLIEPRVAVGAETATGPSGKQYVLVARLPRSPLGALGVRPQPLRWSIAILVSGFICYLLTRHLAGPVLRLQTAARQLSEGNLSARATPALEARRDELGVLVRDFNYMAERIERLVRTQQELIRDISHELRSPLARLTVALELARQRAGEGAEEPLERIELESARLNELIGRLLTLARIQSATAPPAPEPVSLRALIEEIAADARFEAAARGCNVAVSGAHDCVVQGSPELLRSAIENVVRNSIRYTASQTNIEVSLDCGGENGRTAVIHIRDHGPGVPEAELQNLFRPFYRVASARERETGGTGIGLAITEEGMRLHGGSARAQNAPGGGLDVELRLPLPS